MSLPAWPGVLPAVEGLGALQKLGWQQHAVWQCGWCLSRPSQLAATTALFDFWHLTRSLPALTRTRPNPKPPTQKRKTHIV